MPLDSYRHRNDSAALPASARTAVPWRMPVSIRSILFLLLVLTVSTAGVAAGEQPPAPAQGDTFSSTQVAEKLLGQIHDGLQERNSRKMLAAFDREHMNGYLTFRDQVEAFFAQYESFRVYVRLESTSFDGDRGVVIAIFQLEGTPSYNGPEMRREAELTFELTRSEQGWKITGVSPRSFFS